MGARTSNPTHEDPATERGTETSWSVGTTELGFFVLLVGGVLLAGVLAGGGGLGASDIWLYVTVLAVGYMVSRGLAKAGTRSGRDDGP